MKKIFLITYFIFLNRKLVKLHQKYEPAKSRSNNKENTAHSSNSQKQSQPDNRTDSNISLSNYKITLQKKDDNQTDANKSSTKKPETKTGSLDSSEDDAREEHPKDTSNKNFAEATVEKDQMQFLVIKEEPVEWSEVNESEMELIDENEVFHTEMTIKPEIFIESEEQEDEMYSPLTCELCTETFRIPAEWVKHIQTHTDMLPAKRQRRGKPSSVSMSIKKVKKYISLLVLKVKQSNAENRHFPHDLKTLFL